MRRNLSQQLLFSFCNLPLPAQPFRWLGDDLQRRNLTAIDTLVQTVVDYTDRSPEQLTPTPPFQYFLHNGLWLFVLIIFAPLFQGGVALE